MFTGVSSHYTRVHGPSTRPVNTARGGPSTREHGPRSQKALHDNDFCAAADVRRARSLGYNMPLSCTMTEKLTAQLFNLIHLL